MTVEHTLDPGENLLAKPFLAHLEDLRSCILRSLAGCGAIYGLCLWFALPLWGWIHTPLIHLKTQIPFEEIAFDVGEEWNVLYLWAPGVAALFLGAPWIAYQVWRFVSPGLYRRERRWTLAFLASFATLFVAGGAFGYYFVLPSSLSFLLGLGHDLGITRFVRLESYFNSFITVLLGSGLSFEMPVIVLFLTLLGIVTPQFLWRHVRHATLVIAIVAAVVTPSPSPRDMALVAIPLLALFLVGVVASLAVTRWRRRKV